MEKLLKYSVLRYLPSKLSGEKINLGILFSEENTGYHSFYCTKNFQRIKYFDDELEKKTLRDFLTEIKEDVESEWNRENFDIDEFIKFYINSFCFEKTASIIYEDLDSMIESLKKAYFRFDYAKGERPSKTEDQRILAKLIRSSGTSLYRNKTVKGRFEEDIQYDLMTQYYYIKLFDFDGKNLKRCINTAKTWAWNCSHETGKKIYIIYRYSDKNPENKKEFQIIKNIFDESGAHFCSIDDSIKIVQGAG